VRQRVAIAEGDSLRFFTSERGKVTQIAQILNPGFEVRDIIGLGDVLTEALGLNGQSPAPAPAPVKRQAEAPKQLPPKRRVTRPRPLDIEHVVAWLRDGHEGSTLREIAKFVWGDDDAAAAVAARDKLAPYEDQGVWRRMGTPRGRGAPAWRYYSYDPETA